MLPVAMQAKACRTVAEPAARRVSIVIPTLGNRRIAACLQSLRRNISTDHAPEIVVVLNRPSPADLVKEMELWSVRLVTSTANLGFAGGCNRGAAEASGEFLVLLNDDVEVLPGWLEALVETADQFPDVGAIGSLILFPDGTVQEAGNIVWRDGSTLGISRSVPAEANPYNFLRYVDYCSACSLLVRKQLWDALGGFDTSYFPAYYEDVDFCFKLARAGSRTLFQPRSRVVHHESCSSSAPRKSFLNLRNRKTFLDRWPSEVLAREAATPADPRAVARAAEKGRGPWHLLIIDDRPPQRGSGSGFSVLLDAIEALDGSGYAISVVASDRIDGDTDILARLGVHVIRASPETALSDFEEVFDRVLISRPHNFVRYAPLVRRYQPNASLTYLAEALFFRRMQRQLELISDPAERQRRSAEMLEARCIERAITLEADEIICVSDEEAAILASVPGHCPIEVKRPLAPDVVPTASGFAERADLLFTPGWLAGDESPNVDALRWFAEQVLPRLLDARPDLRLLVTGADPPPAARALASAAIDFVGFVPRLRPVYEAARVAVVPMRVGAGVKLKCLEALQYGVPVVSTSVGIEGLGLLDSRAVAVNDDPSEFARAVLRLYESPEAWSRQRAYILRVIKSWSEQREPTWSRVLAPKPGGARDASQNVAR